MFAKKMDRTTESYSADTLSGQCGSVRTIRAGLIGSQRLAGLTGSTLMPAKLSSRSFLGLAMAGLLAVSLACSSLGDGADVEYAAPEASSPPIYVQQGVGSNIAEELELYITRTAEISDRDKGQLRALSIDDLNSSVGRNGRGQPIHITSVSVAAQVSKLPSPAAATVPTAKQSPPEAPGIAGQNPGISRADSNHSDSYVDGFFEGSVEPLFAATFTDDTTAEQNTASVVNVDDEDEDDEEEAKDAE